MAEQKLADTGQLSAQKGRSLLARLRMAVLVLLAFVVLDELTEVLYELDAKGLRRRLEQLHHFCIAYSLLRPLVLEPTGQQQSRLRASVPPRSLTEEEVRRFDADGVILLRGLVQNKELLKELVPGLEVHQGFYQAYYTRPWEYNGVARAMLAQEELLPLFSSLLLRKGPGRMTLHEAPIWGYRRSELPKHSSHIFGSWHMDQARHNSDEDMVSLWLALTKAPHAIEFIRGTHHIHKEFALKCNESWGRGERFYYEPCVHNVTQQLTEELGSESIYWEDLEPGDGFLFHGNTAHRPVKWAKSRTALSMRFAAFTHNVTPPCGDPTIVFGPSLPNPMACVNERVMPRPPQLWPEIFDRWLEPNSKEWGPWMLRQVVAAVSWAVFPGSPNVL